jgi:hypothetical protein
MSLEASWARTTAHLLEARARLSVPDPALKEFVSFLEHNELELALDELVELALEVGAPRGFWNAAAEAAAEMKLENEARRCRTMAESG